MNIEKLPPFELNISIDKAFVGGNLLRQHHFEPDISIYSENSVLLTFKFNTTATSTDYDFKTNINGCLSFIVNKSNLDKKLLANCLTETKEYMNSIYETIYKGKTTILEVIAPNLTDDDNDMIDLLFQEFFSNDN